MMEFPGEKLVIRIWESVERASGGFLAPWQRRRIGKADADVRSYDALLAAQTERHVELIRTGAAHFDTADGLVLPSPISQGLDSSVVQVADVPLLRNRAIERVAANQLRKEVNLVRALRHAEDEAERLSDEGSEEKGAVDPDWMTRWVRSAGDVSSENLQQLWGKVLAGEVNRPGSYSFRTLDLLANLSHSDAQMIARLGPLVIDGDWIAAILPESSGSDKYGVSFDDLLSLRDMGITTEVGGLNTLTKQFTPLSNGTFLRTLRVHDKLLVLKGDDFKGVVNVPAILLTAAGRQILSLGTFVANEEYVRDVAKAAKGENITALLANACDVRNGVLPRDKVVDITHTL